MDTQSLKIPAHDESLTLAPSPRDRRRRSAWRLWLERLLFVIGICCLGYYAYVYVEARLYQSFEDRQLDEILASRSGSSRDDLKAPGRRVPPAQGATMGRIEIPRLGVSAVVRAGSDARTLRLAVGYIPGTALPGERGNVGLAGHRDTFFRRLRDIRPDDEIRITTPDGMFTYVVQRTNIVKPGDVWVLDPTSYPALTLVTCYPFSYIGSAPQRFIVRAGLRPDENPSDSPPASKPSE
jgi:sortase A